MVIKTKVEIPALLPSIWGQSTSSTRPIQIYMDVGVLLIRFEYKRNKLKKTLLEM